MNVARLWLGGLLVVLFVVSAAAQSRTITVETMWAEKRVALVIGNAGYAPPADLKNPLHDANDMAQALRALGFDVILRTNADLRTMQRAVRDFGDRLRPDGIGLFYYAGHGVQVRGANYLLPIGVKIDREDEVQDEAIDVSRVLTTMADSRSRVSIVILDACRDNPFARSFRSTNRGLAVLPAPSGTFIAYATGPGSVAADGTGRNGLFTGELLRVMREPGLTIEGTFKRVVSTVRQQTADRQVPWTLSSLDGDFIFALPSSASAGGKPPVPVVLAPPPPKLEGHEEIRQELGSLALTSPVAGVEVWLDDQKIWTTRPGAAYVLSNVLAGARRLTARKAGYRDWEREIQLAANQRVDVVIDIEALGPAKTIRNERDDAEMVLVPAGEFWMGSDAAEVERFKLECQKSGGSEEGCRKWGNREAPRHRVYLDAFYIDRHEVTNAQFERFVRTTGHRTAAEREGSGWAYQQQGGRWQWNQVNGAQWRNPNGPGSSASPDHPVVQVSWNDADAYCRWAGKRLPTEAEWEKAARGTDGRRYPWGEDWDATKANGHMTVGTTRSVGSYPGGASPYGASDMAGNAHEWVADWLDESYYQSSPVRNPTGPSSGQDRVLRGGSWDAIPFYLRTSFRGSVPPNFRYNYIGFRCGRGL